MMRSSVMTMPVAMSTEGRITVFDSVAAMIERIGEEGITRECGDDGQEIEMGVDSLAVMAIVGFGAHSEEHAAEHECARDSDAAKRSFLGLHE
jgi:hypothetical protein